MTIIKNKFSLKKAKFLYIIISLIIVSVWLINKVYNHGNCHDAEKMEFKNNYKGIVLKKYIDNENHNYKIVEIQNGRIHKELMDWDKSGLFEFVQKGDSILKELNTLEVKVFRNNVKTTFIIDYGCSD